MTILANDTACFWTSAKGRERRVRVVTPMKCSPHYLVCVVQGLPGESGTFHLVPHASLVALR